MKRYFDWCKYDFITHDNKFHEKLKYIYKEFLSVLST